MIAPLMLGTLGTPELIIVFAVIMLLFGANKLPELARGSGRALRIFKAETKGLHEDAQVVPAGLDASIEGAANGDARADGPELGR